MKSTLLKLGLLVAVTMLPAGAAEVNHSWEQLTQTLKPGKQVVVTRMDGKKAEGKLFSLTEESIIVARRKLVSTRPDKYEDESITVERGDVFRVRVANIRMRHTLIGMAIGAGVGVVWGAKLGDINRGLSVAIMGGLGTGIGAAAGGALPIGAPLYEAPGGLKRK